LVLLSRQLQVVAETVDEVRFTLDSVFIGPAERQTIELDFGNPTQHHPMFLEDLLSWIRNFASDEGLRLIQDGGKFGVGNTFLPIVRRLATLVFDAPASSALPQGFYAPRVTLALKDLQKRLQDLANLATPIKHVITPEPSFGLPFRLNAVEPTLLSLAAVSTAPPTQVFVTGSGFQNGATVTLTQAGGTPSTTTYFRSENLLAVGINIPAVGLATGSVDIQVKNMDGSSAKLRGALMIDP
jgi:hypothetical protein